MKKQTHTHRGHCQLCASVQAIDMRNGIIAKHGYTVKHGYFVGECPGSGVLSLHTERSKCDAEVERAKIRSESARRDIARAEAGKLHPILCHDGNYEDKPDPRREGRTMRAEVMVPFEQAPRYYQEQAVRRLVWELTNIARSAEDYAALMTKYAAKIFDGKVPAYRVEDLEAREWRVGDTIRIGGKKGTDLVIEAIEDRPYKTHGWRRGSSTVMTPHALVTWPAVTEKRSKICPDFIERKARPATQAWEPLRNVKREAPALAAELKKEGLL